MDPKIQTKKYDIISSGSVIIPADDYLKFSFDNLNFIIQFEEEEKDKDGNLPEARYEIRFEDSNSDSSSFLLITFYNVSASLFSSMASMLKLATYQNKALYLKFCIQSINATQDMEDKLFFYTWYLDKESVSQSGK